jgi:hypothetical protein
MLFGPADWPQLRDEITDEISNSETGGKYNELP